MWLGDQGGGSLPHLVVQVHEVPLEVVRENVVLAASESRRDGREREGESGVRQMRVETIKKHVQYTPGVKTRGMPCRETGS